MQTSLRYQIPETYQRPVRYTLSGNLKQKYNQLSPQFQQILRSTQKCPFTQIRQLIILFQRNNYSTTDLTICDILQQKYQQNPKLQIIDTNLNKSISQLQISSLRFNKLNQCIEQYNTIYDQLRKPIITNQQKMLPNQNQYEYQDRRQNKNNYNRLAKQNKYFQYVTYSQQFQRALIVASASQSLHLRPEILNKQNPYTNTITNFRILNDYSNKIIAQVEQYLNIFIKLLFQWREIVKHDKNSQQHKNKCNQKIQQWTKKVTQIQVLYTQMSFFSTWLQKDRDQLRRVYDNNSRDYIHFLPNYIKTKQIYQLSSRNSTYREIIKEQKNLLQNHLRKNYGMIVPYSPSPQFTNAIMPIQAPRNRQLKVLLAQQLTPLEDGIYYINGQYQKLYKEVCDNRDSYGVRRKIEENIKKFTYYSSLPSHNNTFALHLMQSCQKLLRIAK